MKKTYAEKVLEIVNKAWQTVKPYAIMLDDQKKFGDATIHEMAEKAEHFATDNHIQDTVRETGCLDAEINGVCGCLMTIVSGLAARKGLAVQPPEPEQIPGQTDMLNLAGENHG
jgi:hypothetical protein